MSGQPSSPAPDLSVLDMADALSVEAPRGAVVGLSTTFTLDQPVDQVARATLVATAHGIYEAFLNQQPVSDAVLSPWWTAYEARLAVQSIDVTGLIAATNTLTVRLAEGWYRGALGIMGMRVDYGERTAFLAALVVDYRDGSRQIVPTTRDWVGHTTDTTAASLYHGQTIDARLRQRPAEQLPVTTVDLDRSALFAQVAPPVVRHESLRPVAVLTTPSGKTVVDFGQNLVGWTHCAITAPTGTTVTLRHAEALDGGEIATRPLRLAKATDTFICSGDPVLDVFEPTATFHGFRYVEVTGWPGTPSGDDLVAVVVHTAMTRTGWFTCSDARLDRLVENSVWSQRGNFLALPTDCPQRDERLGWTGDIAVYAPTALSQFDCATFLDEWLRDLAAETARRPSGVVPVIVPDLFKYVPPENLAAVITDNPQAVWSDAAVWVPEALWWARGDQARLAEQYPAMVSHLTSVERDLSATGLWDGDAPQFGDWLDPDAPADQPARVKADRGVVATACLYRSARFAAHTARILGVDDDATRWDSLAERTRDAFCTHYVTDDAHITSDCATVYALAITHGLLDHDPALRQRAGDRLAELVTQAGYRVSTGFAGSPQVAPTLTATGHVDVAYALMLETACPSWLYPVTMGATTVWERWDAMLPDGTVNPGQMTSFNHYALGAVVHWLTTTVAGIEPAEPGYARIALHPTPGPGLDWADATLDTPVGRVQCGWRRVDDTVVVTASVPEGIAADLTLPDGATHTLEGGSHTFTVS